MVFGGMWEGAGGNDMFVKEEIWGKGKGCTVRPLGHKGKYSRSTLKTWTKDELINYIECCEHNERVMAETLQQQAINFEKMLKDLILRNGNWLEENKE